MTFDPSLLERNLKAFWNVEAEFGAERHATDVYLRELVSDRFALTRGVQVLHDELQFAHPALDSSLAACGADFSVPSVVTTLAHSNCGDRINQGRSKRIYEMMVGKRFATLSERGELKVEAFYPTGGGTDDGATLANVTNSHMLDERLCEAIYAGNPRSYRLLAFDLKTHCGRFDAPDGQMQLGLTAESPWREPRSACGAIVGALFEFNPENPVHRRIRRDLGEDNFELLSTRHCMAEDGTDITALVAAAIVCVSGVRATAEALVTELDERGVAHLTASVALNRPSHLDPLVYLCRTTVHAGTITHQGLGTDASKYAGRVHREDDQWRVVLSYDQRSVGGHPIERG